MHFFISCHTCFFGKSFACFLLWNDYDLVRYIRGLELVVNSFILVVYNAIRFFLSEDNLKVLIMDTQSVCAYFKRFHLDFSFRQTGS
jgi:hypothetical protein